MPLEFTRLGVVRIAIFLFSMSALLRAHDGLDLDPPTSDKDAWNMIGLCRANMEKLVSEKQWADIPIQASLSLQALRYLRENADSAHEKLRPQIQESENQCLFIVRSAMDKNPAANTQRDVTACLSMLDDLAQKYDPAIVHAQVFSCPMCRGIRELDPNALCFKCGMALVPRVIPASSIYNVPGQPSIALTTTLDHPLTVGERSEIKIRFTRKKDGAPITPDDLLLVHTQRIHLLIIDESLGDYHHEHPVPTDTPGEYKFAFTPHKPGAYRVFADVVPSLSNVQEYPACDLPAAGKGEPLQDRADTTSAIVDGLRYELKWDTNAPAQARQPVLGKITVTDATTGQPFTGLEPIMGTFAHIVAFHEDRQTVIHIHPLGTVPQQPADRSGPSFTFRFYAPKSGFYRLYAQVQIGGASHFAPFGLNVAE